MLAIAVRFVSGIVRAIDEATDGGTFATTLTTLLAPAGTTMGILALGLALLIVFAPSGAVSREIYNPALLTAGLVVLLVTGSILVRVIAGADDFFERLAFVLFDRTPALILAGAAWWSLQNFDSKR